jgi:hypothetical protein
MLVSRPVHDRARRDSKAAVVLKGSTPRGSSCRGCVHPFDFFPETLGGKQAP